VRDHTVTLHLAEAETTVARTTFGRLSSQDLCRAPASRVDFIRHHMLQSLVEGWPEEDHHLETLACEARVHDFVAVSLVAERVQHAGHKLNRLSAERCRIAFIAVETDYFREQTLDQMTNRHSRRDSVRVDNHVRVDSLYGEWQVFLPISYSARSLLSMPTGKFVTNHRDLDRSHLDLNVPHILFIRRHAHLVNYALFRVL